MIVLIGERANGVETHGREPSSLDVRILCGAFRSGASARFLEGLEIHWDVAFNLLPAIPTRWATWLRHDRRLARDVARQTLDRYGPQRALVVLAGSRVAWAFNVRYEPGCRTELDGARILVIPHPSPRNRAWNDRGLKRVVASAFKEAAGETA